MRSNNATLFNPPATAIRPLSSPHYQPHQSMEYHLQKHHLDQQTRVLPSLSTHAPSPSPKTTRKNEARASYIPGEIQSPEPSSRFIVTDNTAAVEEVGSGGRGWLCELFDAEKGKMLQETFCYVGKISST